MGVGGGGLEDQNRPLSLNPLTSLTWILTAADVKWRSHSLGGTQTFLGNEDGPPSRLASLIMQCDFPRASAAGAICCLSSFATLLKWWDVGRPLFGGGLHIKRELPSRGRKKEKLRFIATQCCLTLLYQKERPAPPECAHQHLSLPAPRGPIDAWRRRGRPIRLRLGEELLPCPRMQHYGRQL